MELKGNGSGKKRGGIRYIIFEIASSGSIIPSGAMLPLFPSMWILRQAQIVILRAPCALEGIWKIQVILPI
jgi:hypothetical protein